jgi:hypothetical protein
MDDKPVIRQLIGNDFAPPRIVLDVDDPDDVPRNDPDDVPPQPCRFCPSRFILGHIAPVNALVCPLLRDTRVWARRSPLRH